MGEVYRATDGKLRREVAIKVLPSGFTADKERLARFEREAQILAQLQHPNIASIYGLEESHGVLALVMELVAGPTLADRLVDGALPLEETVSIARQIAEALEAAHEKGIVHRDLKPQNIKAPLDGTVKVLDFGLAKAMVPGASQASSSPRLTASPTLTLGATSQGLILGTAAYMSPEQAKGQAVDKRADIWSFGVVLWEMSTGGRLFQAPTTSETLALVLTADPDFAALPATTPAALRELLRRCLERNPRRRLHDIADARLVLEDLVSGEHVGSAPALGRPSRSRVLPAAAAAAGGLLTGILAVGLPDFEPRPAASEPVTRFEIPVANAADARPALSPDGTRLAYSSESRLWVRDLDRLEPAAVEGGEGGASPFWSPDGESLGFFAERAIWRIPVTGGTRTLLTEIPPGTSNAGLWLPGDRVLFTTGASGVLEVPARGGQVNTRIDLLDGEIDFHGLAGFRDEELVASVHYLENEQYGNLTVLSEERRTQLANFPGEGLWGLVVSEAGWVLFERQGSRALPGVWAVPVVFDPLRATGDPRLVAQGARAPTVRGETLVFSPGPSAHLNELVWVDRAGRVLERVGEPRRGLYPTLALSPDGRSAAVTVAERLGSRLWTVDLESGRFRQVTFDPGNTYSTPAWTPDGEQLFYPVSTGPPDQRILRKTADTSTQAEEVTRGNLDVAVSPDGHHLAFSRAEPGFRQDLWIRDLQTGEETALSTTPDWDQQPAFSPDGKLLAFVASGDVVVASLPTSGQQWLIARGGRAPKWDASGSRLYFLDGGMLMEVAIEPGPPFRSGEPTALFAALLAPAEFIEPSYAVAGNGDRFLLVRTAGRPPGLVVVRGWTKTLGG
jgi:eukaryotic-like serine/threonine-protein kinase